jgi:hypothetical protein
MAIETVTRRVQTRLKRKWTGPHAWLVITRRPLADENGWDAWASRDATDQDSRYRYHYYPTPTLTQVRSGLSLLLMAAFYAISIPSICRQVHHQLVRNELARFDHYRTRNCIPSRKLYRYIQ